MPELAEVETVRNTLKKKILHKKIKDVIILYDKMIENPLDEFKKILIGNEFIDIKRRGKYLLFELDNYFLISHLRMEGKYYIKAPNEEILKHEHVIFDLGDIRLHYHDTRKFGRMHIINKKDEEDYFKNLGPDANSSPDAKKIYEKISKKNIPIKTILLDQSIIAGLGNIYVDEVLYLSKINPLENGNKLTIDDIQNILKSSKEILDKAIKYKGTTIRSYTSSLGVYGEYQQFLKVHTKDGTKCSCGAIIEKIKVGGRSTYYCPNCQRLK